MNGLLRFIQELIQRVAQVVQVVQVADELANQILQIARLMARVLPRVVFLRVVVMQEKKEKREPLILPPGAGLRDMLHFIYPTKIAERIFDQIIADMQLEWQEAMIHEKKWLACWVRVRGVLTVFLTAAVHVVATLGSIFKMVK